MTYAVEDISEPDMVKIGLELLLILLTRPFSFLL